MSQSRENERENATSPTPESGSSGADKHLFSSLKIETFFEIGRSLSGNLGQLPHNETEEALAPSDLDISTGAVQRTKSLSRKNSLSILRFLECVQDNFIVYRANGKNYIVPDGLKGLTVVDNGLYDFDLIFVSDVVTTKEIKSILKKPSHHHVMNGETPTDRVSPQDAPARNPLITAKSRPPIFLHKPTVAPRSLPKARVGVEYMQYAGKMIIENGHYLWSLDAHCFEEKSAENETKHSPDVYKKLGLPTGYYPPTVWERVNHARHVDAKGCFVNSSSFKVLKQELDSELLKQETEEKQRAEEQALLTNPTIPSSATPKQAATNNHPFYSKSKILPADSSTAPSSPSKPPCCTKFCSIL